MKKILYIIPVVVLGVLIVWFIFANKSQEPTLSQNQIGEKVYVAVEGTGEVVAINTKTRKEISRINLTEEVNGKKINYMPHNLQVAPDNKSVWVTANAMKDMEKMSFQIIRRAYADEGHGEAEVTESDQVIIINPLTDKIIRRIEMGQGLHLSHVALTTDSAYAIVAAQEKGVIYKINTSSYEVEKQVETKKGAGPHGLRISPDGKTAFIAMLSGKSLGVLDIKSMELSDIPLKGVVVQTGVTADGKYALASVYDSKSLAVYNIVAKKLSYIDLPPEAKGPVQLYPMPDSRFVYVADQGHYFNQPTGDVVYKVDLTEMKVVKTIKAGKAPHGVAVSKDGKFVYVTNLLSADVSVIDTETDKEVAKIKIGTEPNGVSVWYGDNVSISENKTGSLISEETSFDFGVVSMAKGKVQHSFKIKNPDTNSVKITKIYTSCMCTEATLVIGKSSKGPFGMPGHDGISVRMNETISPGQEMVIDVEVDPSAHGPQGTGPAKKIVYIETDSVTTPKLELALDINVTQ
ncbi:MAG: DUF1573 domain-containing protein [bacterium]|nr:DUF1573 domain-containing protein [bacterium]